MFLVGGKGFGWRICVKSICESDIFYLVSGVGSRNSPVNGLGVPHVVFLQGVSSVSINTIFGIAIWCQGNVSGQAGRSWAHNVDNCIQPFAAWG